MVFHANLRSRPGRMDKLMTVQMPLNDLLTPRPRYQGWQLCFGLLVVLLSCGAPKSISSTGQGNTSDRPAEEQYAGGEATILQSDSLLPNNQKPAPLTFVLRNTSNTSLFLNMEKGWAAVIYAYLGEPPNAKPILMFPIPPCSTLCSSPPNPFCRNPSKALPTQFGRAIERLLPGDVREVTWDGAALSYEKALKKKNGQQGRRCSEQVAVPPGTYTLKACGFRKLSASPTYECATTSVTMPLRTPTRVKIDFP